MPYTDLMIDLETTSTKHNAAIIAIGLVKFNLNNPSVERKSLELLIDENSLTNYDFHTCPETLKWWENQNEDVRNHVFYDQPRVAIEEALDTINEFGKGVYNVWSQGSFDINVLENAYEKTNKKPFWKFYQIRDARTISSLMRDVPFISSLEQPKKPLNLHNPVEDCLHQINVIQFVYNCINNNTLISPIRKKAIRFDYTKDWICKSCNASNFAKRTTCFKCDTIKQSANTPPTNSFLSNE